MFDISDLPLNTATEINIARRRLEDLLSKTDEIQYAKEQCNQWQETVSYTHLDVYKRQITGRGTVATGRVERGTLHLNDNLEILRCV